MNRIPFICAVFALAFGSAACDSDRAERGKSGTPASAAVVASDHSGYAGSRGGVVAADEAGGAPFRLVAHPGGENALTYAVSVEGPVVAFGRGSDLVLADISTPSDPQVLGTVALPGVIRDVVLQGDVAFVAADTAGLQIIDIANPAVPTLLAAMSFDDRVHGVDADRGFAYVAARSAGLYIIDLSDPASPTTVGRIETPDEAVDVVVRENFAFVAAWYESLRVIDVTNRSAPEEVSFASYDSYDNGAAWSVSIEGDLGLATVPDMGLRTVDISNPRNVRLHKVYRGLFAPVGVAARGRLAFVADQSAGLRILDLENPALPVEIGATEITGRAMAVALDGDIAYVAAREGGLRIVDVSQPLDPREIAAIDSGDETADVAVTGDTIVAAGLQNGATLFRRGQLESPASRVQTPARRVVVSDGRLLLARETGVAVYDLSDVSRPLAEADISGSVRAVAGTDGLVVAATEQFGLRILEAESGTRMREIGSFEAVRAGVGPNEAQLLLRTPVAAWDVLMNGNQAMVAFDDGIRLIDLSTPSRPKLVTLLKTPERAYRLTLHGSRIYAACDDGLRTFDVSPGEAPRQVGYVKTPTFATAVASSDDRIFVGDLGGTITVVGAQRPDVPIWKGRVAQRILGLAIVPGGLAVAAGREGLQILEYAADEKPSNTVSSATASAR